MARSLLYKEVSAITLTKRGDRKMYGDKSITLTQKQADAFRKIANAQAAAKLRQMDRIDARRSTLDNERWNLLNLADKLY